MIVVINHANIIFLRHFGRKFQQVITYWRHYNDSEDKNLESIERGYKDLEN